MPRPWECRRRRARHPRPRAGRLLRHDPAPLRDRRRHERADLLGLGAAVGGPVFGLAGHTWRTGEHRYRALALGLLAAAFIAEAGYHLLVLSEPGVAVGFAVAGLLVPVVLGRSREDRLGAYVAAVPALALGAAGFVVFIWIYDVTSRIQA